MNFCRSVIHFVSFKPGLGKLGSLIEFFAEQVIVYVWHWVLNCDSHVLLNTAFLSILSFIF